MPFYQKAASCAMSAILLIDALVACRHPPVSSRWLACRLRLLAASPSRETSRLSAQPCASVFPINPKAAQDYTPIEQPWLRIEEWVRWRSISSCLGLCNRPADSLVALGGLPTRNHVTISLRGNIQSICNAVLRRYTVYARAQADVQCG
jgi:hypothetical protein